MLFELCLRDRWESLDQRSRWCWACRKSRKDSLFQNISALRRSALHSQALISSIPDLGVLRRSASIFPSRHVLSDRRVSRRVERQSWLTATWAMFRSSSWPDRPFCQLAEELKGSQSTVNASRRHLTFAVGLLRGTIANPLLSRQTRFSATA
jgi:hypothetical protein